MKKLLLLLAVIVCFVSPGNTQKRSSHRSQQKKTTTVASKKTSSQSAKISQSGMISGHRYVDLGLPSGTKWAVTNVGAKTPYEYGDYITGPVTISDLKWGGNWTIPTRTQYEELMDACSWQYMKTGNKPGYKVTGPNGKFIFLPAGGGISRLDGKLHMCDDLGYYWTSTTVEGGVTTLAFGSTWYRFENRVPEYWKLNVRMVIE